MAEKKVIRGKSGVAFFEYTSWCHRYKVMAHNGKVTYKKKKGFKTEEEAVESYYRLQDEFEQQSREFCIVVDKDIMVKDYIIRWFENVYSERIETTTQMVTSYIVYNLIVPNIDYNVKMSLATPDYLNGIIAKASQTSDYGGVASRSIIIMAFKDAVLEGYITYNPALKTKPYKRPKPKIRVFSINEMKKFLEEARQTIWYVDILCCLFCGLRKGELMGLKFADIDFENNSLCVQRQLVSDYELEKGKFKVRKVKLVERLPKTEAGVRKIGVPDLVINEIKRCKVHAEENKKILKDNYFDNDYVSCQTNGKPHSTASLNKALDLICNHLCLPHITAHSLRHMCATILLEQGASLAKISAFLGHQSIHTTFKYYCEVMDEKDKILAFMNEVFSVDCEEEYAE